MSKQNHICPFLKTACIGCSLYRGRHKGFLLGQAQADSSHVSAEGDSLDWIASLNAFFEKVRDR